MDTVITNHDGTRAIGFVSEDPRGGCRVVMGTGEELTQEQVFEIFGNVFVEAFEVLPDPAAAPGVAPDLKTVRLRQFRIRSWAMPAPRRRIMPTPMPTAGQAIGELGGKVLELPRRRRPWRHVLEDSAIVIFVSSLVAFVVLVALWSLHRGA